MREMTLQDIQEISLDIMQRVHTFCVDHSIKYSLGYGSMIGCIRHKGFIPWDDDLDIVMLRDDFERFCQLWKDEPQYKLFAPQRNNTYLTYGRVCEMMKTSVVSCSPSFTESSGVWIDIFPLDSVESGDVEFKKRIRKEAIYSKLLYLSRSAMIKMSNVHGLISKSKHLVKKILLWGGSKSKWLVSKYDHFCKRKIPNSPYIGNLTVPVYREREKYLKSYMKICIKNPFEDKQFFIMKEYDAYLRTIYGDYMKLPPYDKRVVGHGLHHYYWK